MSYLDRFFDGRKVSKTLTPEQQKAMEERRQSEQRQKIIDFKKFFSGEHGQTVIFDLMNKFYILRPLPDTVDPLALARAEGNREVVLYLLQRANMSVEMLDKIMKGEFV